MRDLWRAWGIRTIQPTGKNDNHLGPAGRKYQYSMYLKVLSLPSVGLSSSRVQSGSLHQVSIRRSVKMLVAAQPTWSWRTNAVGGRGDMPSLSITQLVPNDCYWSRHRHPDRA